MEVLLIVLLIIALFYIILLRPVLQQQRRQRRDISNLEVGDEVLTAAGFLATVREIKVPEEGPVELMLDLGGGVEVRALTSAVTQRISRPAPANAESEKSASDEKKGERT
jgi:preprotein translocase subunit YajC